MVDARDSQPPQAVMSVTRLTDTQIENGLASLPGWSRVDHSICKTFHFTDFEIAFAWMTQVAQKAEARNHHPDWRNVYNRVEVTLTTHDADGLTALDFELAREMESAQAG